jgi:7-carboxy-7-deazaguanine synthase
LRETSFVRFSELFHSIQGEGGLAGTPSVFVRTSGCNLRCWFCDTPYTSWEPERTRVDWRDLLDEVLAIDCRHVVVTGGEPLLQPEAVPLTHALRDAGRHVTIETAGTVFRPVAADLISLSPKLANSTPTDALRPSGGRYAARHDRLRDNPDTVRRLTTDYDYQLKFVVDSPADLADIDAYLARHAHLDRDKVFLMPQARTAAELEGKTPWIEHEATTRGLRTSPRLHVEWWGDKRGV